MKQYFIKLISLCIVTLLAITSKSQVTIGSNNQPEVGALLQLSELPNQDNSSSITSTKGLLLPRIALKEKTHNSDVYETIIQQNSTSSSSHTIWNTSSHTGLTIYNTTDDLNKNLCPGVYTWETNTWVKLGPPCITTPKLKLYNDKKEIIATGNNEFIFNSGVNTIKDGQLYTSVIKEQIITAEWTPNNIQLTVNEIESSGYSPNNIVFNQIASPYNAAASAAVNITPERWDNDIRIKNIITDENNPAANGGYNPFYHEKTTLKFKITNAIGTDEQTIFITQVHKNLILVKADQVNNKITVQSNGIIRAYIRDSNNTVYQELGIYGAETIEPLTIEISVPAVVPPNSHIIIEDFNLNDRFIKASNNKHKRYAPLSIAF